MPMDYIVFDSSVKILIVSPHPDDEVIGCGGIMLKYGPQCDVLLITDGCNGHRYWTEDRTRRIRKSEFLQVMHQCNVNNYFYLGIKDRTVNGYFDIYSIINVDNYDVVFVPNKRETHPDHKAAYNQLLVHAITHFTNWDVYQYEVWSPLTTPTHIIDLSTNFDEKASLLSNYKSQVDELNYIEAIRGLNIYRGETNHMKYAECFTKGY